MRTRTRFLLLVLYVLVPALVAAALAVAYVYRDARLAQNRSMTETARAMALLVDNELQKKEEVLRALAASPALLSGKLPDFYLHAGAVVPAPEATVILFDPAMRAYFDTRLPYGSPLPVVGGAQIGAVQQVRSPVRTLVSDLYRSQVTGQPDFAIQVPVQVDGTLRYRLSMGVSVLALQRLLMRQQLPEGWLATIVDRAGVVVARSREPSRYTGYQMSAPTRQRLQGSGDKVFDGRTFDGVDARVFASEVPGAGWNVLLSVPVSELHAAPLRAAAVLGGVSALLLLLGVMSARRFAQRTIGPIEALGRSAEALASGAEVHYVAAGWAEIDSVAQRLTSASAQLRQSHRDMAARVAEAIGATERAQHALLRNQKLEALGRLTAGIAHEYNNLLQTLTTALQLASYSTQETKIQGLIQTCQRTVARATSLTGQLGAFGRVQEARMATVEVGEQLRSAVQLMKGALHGAVTVEVHCPDDIWPVTLDPLQFDVALLNLALNARDAMPAGGALRLDVRNLTHDGSDGVLTAGDYVLLSMSDNGSGMTPEVLAHALDPFFSTKPPGQGTGLGLPQAYAFASQAGGTLILDSIAGIGTRIDLYLARAQGGQAPAAASGALPAVRASGTVLFVEDDALVREAVVAALRVSGFEVLVAEDGEAALRLLEQTPRRPDVVFSDIVMPGAVSGIDLADILRQRYPCLPVILATGYTDQHITLPGVQVVAKPYTIETLVRVLNSAPPIG